jgi:hypothetical protein
VEGDINILDARLIKETRQVCQFNYAPVGNTEVFIDFDIMEQSDGCAIQVIYADNPDCSITVTGVSEGPRTPKRIEPLTMSHDSKALLISICAMVLTYILFVMCGLTLTRSTTYSVLFIGVTLLFIVLRTVLPRSVNNRVIDSLTSKNSRLS